MEKYGYRDVMQRSDTSLSFSCDDITYYLDWSKEPYATVFSVYELVESVDLEKAREIAREMSCSCDNVFIKVNDDREMGVCCSTIIPDARSLWAVVPCMANIVTNATSAFFNEYIKADKEESN